MLPHSKLKACIDAVSKWTVIPANAGRSAQRGEHPKDGPEGVSEANHPVKNDVRSTRYKGFVCFARRT
jgi:hypothetical protein